MELPSSKWQHGNLTEQDFYDPAECRDEQAETWYQSHEPDYWPHGKRRQELLNELKENPWRRRGMKRAWKQMGLDKALEPALRSGAIKLLNVHWLIQFACSQATKAAILPRQQELSDEAFLLLDEIKMAVHDWLSSGIIVLSHMWLQPNHPDPFGQTLQLVAQGCQQHCQKFKHLPLVSNRHVALFWDYASLPQHPDPANGIMRNEEEERLFRQGLKYISTLYYHKVTYCVKVTKFPVGYPDNYDLPKDYSPSSYDRRGWTIFENHLATIEQRKRPAKDLCVLEQERTNQVCPLTPQRFREEMRGASFTNGKDDYDRVVELYETFCEEEFGQTKRLSYQFQRWGDKEVQDLADYIQQGLLPKLKVLKLDNNPFGDEGCMALASALTGPKAPQHIEELHLGFNRVEPGLSSISNDGVNHLASALVRIRRIRLHKIRIDAIGCKYIVEAADRLGGHIALEEVDISYNEGFGDDAIQVLAELICGRLRIAKFGYCNVGDEGCRTLANAAAVVTERFSRRCTLKQLFRSSRRCTLEQLNLSGDMPITEAGAQHLCTLVRHCPNLHKMCLPTKLRDSACGKMLKSSASRRDFKVSFNFS